MDDLNRREAMKMAAAAGAAVAGLAATASAAPQQGNNGEQDAMQAAEKELRAEYPKAASPDEKGEQLSAADVQAVRRIWVCQHGAPLINGGRARGIFRIPSTMIHFDSTMTIATIGAWYRLVPQGVPPALGQVVVDVTRQPWGSNQNSVIIWYQRPGTSGFVAYRDDGATAGFAFGNLG